MQMMRLPVISSPLCSRLHFAAPCCHQRVVQASSLPVTPGASAVLFSLLPQRTPKLSRGWMMCSRHQHRSKQRHDSAPLTQAASGWGAFSQFHSCHSAVGLATLIPDGTEAKQEEKLSYQTSKSSKCQTCFASSIRKLCVFFVCLFHITASCMSTQTNWNSSGEVGERPVKISFLLQTVFPGHLLGCVILLSLQVYSWKGK